MNTKKVLMIILLIALIIAIGVVLVNVSKEANNKVVAKSNSDENSNIIQITDNFFIEQTNDVYLNINDYIGKTIKMEGLIYKYDDEEGNTYYAVVRNTPGCCGNDGLAGLDIRYNGEYPEVNTWVEVVGEVKAEILYGSKIPALQVSSLEIKENSTIRII